MFEDVIKETMKTLDTINLFELPKYMSAENSSTDSGDDNSSLVMDEKDLNNYGAISTRTRSRTSMAFHVNALSCLVLLFCLS